MSVRDYGDRAVLVECGSTAEVLALAKMVRTSRPAGVSDIVPGSRTVLVSLTDPAHQAAVRSYLAGLAIPTACTPESIGTPDLVIDVVYDGADLTEVADLAGITVDAVVEAHTETAWQVGFCGFAPGFAYLVGGDARLVVPRRAEPRQRVPAGSVGLAGEFSGIYPRESPGGWQLIGRTDAVLWDLGRPQPALLTPGMRVQFRSVVSK